ncbi:MAG TPA: sugar ABC transporter permease [Clostridiales bacterium]|nr:sugar ABC transporter permease [Clostridiales bacterium]
MKQKPYKKPLTMKQKHVLEGYLFIVPWIIGFSIFFALAFFKSLQLSLSKITKVSGFELEWIGGANYIRAFVWDTTFIPKLIDVLGDIVINTPLTLIFSLFIAMLVNRDIKFRGFFRGTFFLPVLLGTGFVLKQLLGMGVEQQATEVARRIVMPDEILMYLGPNVAGFVDNFMSRITLIFWNSGVQIIIFLAGLQSIPGSLYEASKCDGATVWENFWKITLPMMSPVILLNAIYTLVDSFASSTNPILEYMLGLKVSISQYEYAAALGMIYFMFVFLLVAVVYGVFKRYTYNSFEK